MNIFCDVDDYFGYYTYFYFDVGLVGGGVLFVCE